MVDFSDQSFLQRCLKRVDILAKKYKQTHRTTLSVEELRSAGALGLMLAVQNYDESKSKFNTYAEIRIRGAMLDEVRGVSRSLGGKGPDVGKYKTIDDENMDRLQGEQIDFDKIVLISVLPDKLALLQDIEKSIVERFYLNEEAVKDIAKDLNLTSSRTTQIKKIALNKLRKILLYRAPKG